MTNYTIDLLKKEEIRILDCMDVLNANGASTESPEREGLKSFLNNVRQSIKTLENNRGIVVEDYDGSIILKRGKIEIKSNIDSGKYKWDSSLGNNSPVNQIINNKWKEAQQPSDKKELALSILKEINKTESQVTRLKLVTDDSVTVVEDFSFFCNSDYMSHELLDAIKSKRTLTNEQEVELSPYIREVFVEL